MCLSIRDIVNDLQAIANNTNAFRLGRVGDESHLSNFQIVKSLDTDAIIDIASMISEIITL